MVGVQYNPFTPEVHANPYPLYRQLREEDPVHRSELMEGWILTRYDDVAAVLKDSRFSGNRDPAQFQEPEELDITRKPNKHLAFGYGIHMCLGSPPARVEAQSAFGTLLRRMPDLRLDTEEPEWGGTFILRGLKRLPVAF